MTGVIYSNQYHFRHACFRRKGKQIHSKRRGGSPPTGTPAAPPALLCRAHKGFNFPGNLPEYERFSLKIRQKPPKNQPEQPSSLSKKVRTSFRNPDQMGLPSISEGSPSFLPSPKPSSSSHIAFALSKLPKRCTKPEHFCSKSWRFPPHISVAVMAKSS